jgi:methanogenic corrinoid protein MtbC1
MTGAAEEYLAAISLGDRARALAVVRRLQEAGASPLEVMDHVIAPAQEQVGRLWAADAWSVAQEHAATAVSEAVLSVLGAQVPPPADSSSAPVVVSCVEQEWHALPALLVAEHLRTAGLPVSYLGANASAEHLVRHVHEVGPRAVALSCSIAASLPRVRKHVEAVRATGTPAIVGGAAFDRAGRRAAVLGATGFAPSGSLAVEVIAGLNTAVPPAEPLTHDGVDEGLSLYAEREEVGRRLRDRLTGHLTAPTPDLVPTRWRAALSDHLPHLVGALSAALVTGDRAVLTESVAWLDEVMTHRHAAPGVTAEAVAELADLMREHPVAARMLATVS